MNSVFERPHKLLERRRGVFFRIGLTIALLITFFAFEWKTKIPRQEIIVGESWQDLDETLTPITFQNRVEPLASVPDVSKNKPVRSFTSEIIIVPDGNPEIGNEPTVIDSTEIIPVVLKPESDTADDDFMLMPEIQPRFPGDEKGLTSFLIKNLKFPEIPRREGIYGTAYMTFIIDETGSVVEIKCERSPHPDFTEEATRVLKKMPRWKPGMQGGKPVRVKMTIPVSFRLI